MQASVSSHWAWKMRSRRAPYAAAADSRATIASPAPTGRGQHLGPVLLADRAARPADSGASTVAGGVHRLEGADEVAR